MPAEKLTNPHRQGGGQGPPGLRVLVVYLRPVARPGLLAGLARLGLFVIESDSVDESLRLDGTGFGADLAIVSGDSGPEHASAVRTVSEGLTPAVVAICPPGSSTGAVEEAGAMAFAFDPGPPDLAAAVAPAARLARTRRGTNELAANGSVSVFGTLRMKTEPPRLESAGRLIKLSSTEYAVLGALARRKGDPVGTGELAEAIPSKKDPPKGDTGRTLIRPAVARLRRKAARLGGEPLALSSVRGFGYVLTD